MHDWCLMCGAQLPARAFYGSDGDLCRSCFHQTYLPDASQALKLISRQPIETDVQHYLRVVRRHYAMANCEQCQSPRRVSQYAMPPDAGDGVANCCSHECANLLVLERRELIEGMEYVRKSLGIES